MPSILSKIAAVKLDRQKITTTHSLYAVAGLSVLIITTLFWSILSAVINLHNADQLADPYLFSSRAILHGAAFPGQHTFLIKWPLFWLINLLANSSFWIIFFSVLVSLATVLGLTYFLYKIDKRPLVFGTLCLGLSSVLLAVPTAPYSGALLPTNVAMLATRNIEYILFIISLVLIAKAPRIKSRNFAIGAGSLALLIASDKLFMSLSIGAAILGLTYYALKRKWELSNFSARWLMAGGSATVGAVILLTLINDSGATHIISQGVGSPYGLIHSPKSFVLGMFYGLAALGTNFGANPAFSATILKQFPGHFIHGLFSWGLISYLVNIAVLFTAAYSAIWLLKSRRKRDDYSTLGLMLVWATLVAFIVFVLSDHYYAVDARYLSLTLFSGFICLALVARTKKYNQETWLLIGSILVLAIISGLLSCFSTYRSQSNALASTNAENTKIAQALSSHKVGVLVGDYWRVFPIRHQTSTHQPILPLADCTNPRAELSSQAWRVNLKTTSFAYILPLQKGLTDYPACTLSSTLKAYGKPNASLIVSGTIEKPALMLLFYDHGTNLSAPTADASRKEPATVVPISTDELPYTNCDGPTVLNIVAHQDDDLLFINPDTQKDIDARHCVRTVYVTAGDAGNGSYYWLSRQQGAEAAYSSMTGQSNVWIQRLVKLTNNQYITVANPRGYGKASLIFMNLPDGNMHGEGFVQSKYESLAKLQQNKISKISSVDSYSTYTYPQLMLAIANLMNLYNPVEIRTQANDSSVKYSDHADHVATGKLAQDGYKLYEANQLEGKITIPLAFYMGYPIHGLPPNISGTDLAKKTQTFFTYGKFDGAVCTTLAECNKGPYAFYFTRQYQNQ